MNEADFWLALEFRVGREFAAMSDNRLRHLWCDGFTAQYYLLECPTPCIMGRVWLCNGPTQEEWEFKRSVFQSPVEL
ncbi:MAG: hypothetical protein HY040_13870 [Planctomycetes bacterium]|nr:hypothetical protein [Planctomycetota bacterium]